MTAKAAVRAHVFVRDELAGELTRTKHRASFLYDPAYLQRHSQEAFAAVAHTLPLRAAPYDVVGINLHPFFAGLLPEGLRLKALVSSVKTSEDDLFSLLIAAGPDAVGAVHVVEHGQTPQSRIPIANVRALDRVRFAELLGRSLGYGKAGGDISIAGVMPKVSAAMISVPLRAARGPRSYILKLNPPGFPRLVQNEAFFMRLAAAAGVNTAKVKLVHDAQGEAGLLVERFDRIPPARTQRQTQNQGGSKPYELAQEDICQLLGRYPADKYRLALEDAAAALLEACSAPQVEILRLLQWQALAYAIVNGDMHAKNISVQTVGARVQLTPAYDIVCTLPYGDAALALTMEGRDKKLKPQHFIAFGERHAIHAKATAAMLQRLVRRLGAAVDSVAEIGFDARTTKHISSTLKARLRELSMV